jgi:hypothetical protein
MQGAIMEVKLCDFWAIYSEEQQPDGLIVTGLLSPQEWNEEREPVKAFFPAEQPSPKGSWVGTVL